MIGPVRASTHPTTIFTLRLAASNRNNNNPTNENNNIGFRVAIS